MRCPNCGTDIGNDFGRYCEYCGGPLRVQHSEPQTRRSVTKTLALIAVGIIAFSLLIGGLIVVNSDPEIFYDHPTQSQIDSTRTTGTILSVLGIALIAVVFVGFLYNPRLQSARMPINRPSSDQLTYCPYCGNPLQGAVVCRVCGRSFQK